MRRETVLGLCAFFIVLASLVGSLGCLESRRYCVRRTALVPVVTPSPRPAIPATGIIEAGVSADTVLWARPPERALGSEVGLHVPRVQLSGNLLLSPHRFVSIGLTWETGLAQGALPVSMGQVNAPDSPTFAIGPHVSAHFPVGDTFILDFGCELRVLGVQSRIAYTDADSCDDSLPDVSTWDQKDETTPLISPRAWLALGADLRWSHVTIGFGFRTQPINDEVTEETHSNTANIEADMSQVIYPYAFMGWEFHLQSWAHLSVGVVQPLRFDEVRYAPILGVSFRINEMNPRGRYQSRPRVDEDGLATAGGA